MAQETRSSRWATIIYQESCIDNFVNILKDYHIPFLLSPLHDMDTDDKGSPKKPHWHLMLYFDSLKSQKQVKEIFSTINGVGAEKVQSATSYARYLCHLDEDDKPHYAPDDVVAYGLDYFDCAKNADARYEGISGIIAYIMDESCFSFAKLVMSLSKSKDQPHLFKVVCDNAFLVKSFLTSLKQDQFEEMLQDESVKPSKPTGGVLHREVDPITGEILSGE